MSLRIERFTYTDWNKLDVNSLDEHDNIDFLSVFPSPLIKSNIQRISDAYLEGKYKEEMLANLIKSIKGIAEKLGLDLENSLHQINDWLVELQWILEDPIHDSQAYLKAQFYSYTELISSYLIFAGLEKQNSNLVWLDNRDILITDDDYSSPEIKVDKTDARILNTMKKALDNSHQYVLQYQLASTKDNNSTKLQDRDIADILLESSLEMEG